jgi:hypothetical protein
MKITEIVCQLLRIPHVEHKTASSQDAVIVRVRTDSGLEGIGEADSQPEVVTDFAFTAPYRPAVDSTLTGASPRIVAPEPSGPVDSELDIAAVAPLTTVYGSETVNALTAPAEVQRFLQAGPLAYRVRAVRSRDGAPLYYVEVFVPPAIGRRLSAADLARATVLELLETKLGIPVAGGTEEISAGLADAGLARRLQVRPGTPVLILDVMLHGADGRPLEYARAWYRADQFRRRNQVSRVR